MNKTQLIEALSAHFDGNRRAAAHALESVVDTVMREVAKGEKVAITGFGAFEKAIRPARMVRNPRTGERTRAKKTAVPKFRAGSELKAVVSGAKKLPKVAAGTVASTSSRAAGAAKKSTAKKAGTAKKSSAAKKSTAKKSSAAKKSTKKAPAKKTAAKKSPAKKSTAKKAPARKATAKKSTAKRTAKKS
ncbi:MAG TPA: HU family DNA-binding protein [Nocardioidaceae bacterium]|nr:HU family DNA-binding protein [Nocardioidaceae bacterium]